MGISLPPEDFPDSLPRSIPGLIFLRTTLGQERHMDRPKWRWRAAQAGLGPLLIAAVLLLASLASAAAADRLSASSRLVLGYETDLRPFSYADQSNKPAGYSVALCQKIADAMKGASNLPDLTVDWVAVNLIDRFRDVQSGKIDLLCGADSITLSRRQDVSFSIPIFPGGIGAMLRADSSYALRGLLEKGTPATHPIWRGAPARSILDKKTFSVVAGTTSENWLAGRLKTFQLDATVVPVTSFDSGVEGVLKRSADVFFGDRPILIEAAKRSGSKDLVVLDRLFTREPLALVLARDDEELRLLVDTVLSKLYSTPELMGLYTNWFGRPSEDTRAFFDSVKLAE
jgi:polar amino acid transport system substrate-binding protein